MFRKSKKGLFDQSTSARFNAQNIRAVKKVRKPRWFIPLGFGVVGAWDSYPEWQRDLFYSAIDLDQFVNQFWANLRESRKGTPLDDGRTNVTQTDFAIAAALYGQLKSVDDNYEKRIPTENVDFANAPVIKPKKMLLTYRGILIEVDNDKEFDGNFLKNLAEHLNFNKKIGFKLPITISIAKQGTKTFEGKHLGFSEDGSFVGGEASRDDYGGLRIMLFNQLHNLEQQTELGLDDKKTNGYVNALEQVFFRELGPLWDRCICCEVRICSVIVRSY
jgi:hypothetical protein